MDQTNNNNNNNNFTDAIQQVRQMAKERPNFFRDVKAQMDRDLQSRVKSIIVSKGTQEQKSKSLLRLRTHVVVPTVRLLDRIERKGGWLSYGMLMAMHVVTAVVVCGVCWTGLSVASWKTTTAHDDRVTAAAGHLVAINYAFHMAVFASVMVVRRVVFVMHRKSKVLDQFLQEVLSLSAEQDLGISVHQFATRARLWMKRSTATALTMLMVSLVTYRWMHHSSGIAEVMSVADDDEPSWHQCLVDEEMEWDKL
jgi:hypothetical protein